MYNRKLKRLRESYPGGLRGSHVHFQCFSFGGLYFLISFPAFHLTTFAATLAFYTKNRMLCSAARSPALNFAENTRPTQITLFPPPTK